MTRSLDRLLARWRPPTAVQDSMLAVFIGLMQVQSTLRIAEDQGIELSFGDHAVMGPLLFGSGLILAVRRRWPLTVFCVVAAVSVVYYGVGFPDGPGWIALFVAVYTVTAYGDGARSLRFAVIGLGALTVAWLFAADLSQNERLGWLFFRIGTTVMAITLGESVRMRRVFAAQAHERAERAERTREQEAQRRVDAERLRIAREVHDTVAHAIAIINVQAGVTAHVLDKRPEQARETLRTIEQTSARALRELRTTLEMLTDSTDEDRRSPAPGLHQLDDLTGEARRAGLDVTVETIGAGRELPSALDSASYRILQESITNAIRHAGPSRVQITVHYGDGELLISVADDGRGVKAGEGCAGSGRGIAGMRERCELLGGSLVAGPRPGGGFKVLAALPLRPELVPAAA
ncbi:MAG TPA: sensor histidine kinase [Candidatus Limnocylindrales bacterium]